MSDAIRDYFDAIIPTGATGYLHAALGLEPYLDKNGKYSHKQWIPRVFHWPDEGGDAIKWIEELAPNGDVYCCPNLMRDGKRAKGNAIGYQLVHCDVDTGQLDLYDVEQLGGFVVGSGTLGHGHVYIVLADEVSETQHERLEEALAARLGGDSKIRASDVLRPPDTVNHKGTVTGGARRDVQLVGSYPAVKVEPHVLAAALGVDLSNIAVHRNGDQAGGSSSQEIEPVDLDARPQVQEALAYVTDPPDRSVDTYRIVAACIDDGLTLEQTRWVVGKRPDLVGRLDGRNDDDVLTSWEKITKDRAEHVRIIDQATKLAEWPGHSGQLGMAYRLRAQYPDRLLYVKGIGWLWWDGTRYVRDDIGKAKRAVYALLKLLWHYVNDTDGDDEDTEKRKAILKATIVRCESSHGVNGVLELAQALPRIAATPDELDADPYQLNTPDGIINLRTGVPFAHDPAARNTKLTGVGYDPNDDCPLWKEFLATTFGGDQELIDYVQRVAGYAAIGEVIRHILPFLHGAGDNGKTVLLEVISAILGDYAISAPANFLLAGRDKHETEIARLHGARFVVCSEINQGSKFDESKVKTLTGGDRCTGRFLFQNFFNFTPSHTLILMGNHQPEVSAGGKSFWRRLRLIPFKNEIPEGKRNEHLAHELVEKEGPAILAWIVAGAQAFVATGLDDPDVVMAATQEYAEEEDHVLQFINECATHVSDQFKQPFGKVYKRYQSWCEDNGIGTPKNTRLFGRELVTHGFGRAKSGSKRYVLGIMLDTPAANDPRNPR